MTLATACELTGAEERLLRGIAGGERCPVKVSAKDPYLSPVVRGERAYHTFRGSDTVVHAPGSALKAGFRLDYHPSTYRVVVGAAWVELWRAGRWREKNRAKIERVRRMLWRSEVREAPPAVQADWLEDRGRADLADLWRADSELPREVTA